MVEVNSLMIEGSSVSFEVDISCVSLTFVPVGSRLLETPAFLLSSYRISKAASGELCVCICVDLCALIHRALREERG